MAALSSYSQVGSYNTRQYSNQVAQQRWLASPRSFLIGKDLGANMLVYSPYTHVPYNEGPYIDEAWLTMAVKGGLFALVSFAALVVAISPASFAPPEEPRTQWTV